MGTLVAGLTRAFAPVIGIAAFLAIIPSTIFVIVFMVPTILVFVRLNHMKKAADNGDVSKLKNLNSMGWAIVALIFAGVIPGIMLLVAHSPIEELDKTWVAKATATAGAEMSGATQDSGAITSDKDLLKLQQLKEMLDNDLITQQDYDEQKKKILGVVPAPAVSQTSVRQVQQTGSTVIKQEVTTAKHCRNCGKEVAAQAVFCPGCGIKIPSGKNFCQNCGQANKPEAAFCVKCGAKLV